ncbi:hypothetical protein LJC32_06365 [Oscillospiraceae bacterium OttesenSCG-928-F05]|nr:hypothetical protein [Oscillospiraceae bacterium OttesenSCG-928-F05]
MRHTLGVPTEAPEAIDKLASRYGATVLRQGRDSGARRALSDADMFRDGLFAAAALLTALSRFDTTIEALDASIPAFSTATVEIPLAADRAAVMRALGASVPETSLSQTEGLRLNLGENTVHIAPLSTRRAIRIISEAASSEIAEDLCVEFSKRARLFAKKLPIAHSPQKT